MFTYRVLLVVLGLMSIFGTESAKNAITRFAKQKLLMKMNTAFGYDLSSLTGHQIQQLIDDKWCRQLWHSTARQRNAFTTYRTAETVGDAGLRCHRFKTSFAEGVWTAQQFRRVLTRIVCAHARATCQKSFGEVLVVDRHCFNQRRRGHHFDLGLVAGADCAAHSLCLVLTFVRQKTGSWYKLLRVHSWNEFELLTM